MSCCFQIQKIKLPKQFLFDSLRFHAQFQSASVELLNLGFDISKSLQQRHIPLGIKLKVPSILLQIKIINMRIRSSQIVIDLSSNWKECQYIFGTQMGRVSAFAHVIEHHSLPRELQMSGHQESALMSASEASQASYNKQGSQNNNLKKQTTSKQINTNDEQQQAKTNKYSNLLHFQL